MAGDYDEMLRLMAHLHHLQPPSGMGPVRIDRFSPYHQTPVAYGMGELLPLPVYAHLYRRDQAVLTRIAAYFEPSTSPIIAGPHTVARIDAAVNEWRKGPRTRLQARDDSAGLHLTGDAVTSLTLTGLERAAYLVCDRVASPAQVAAVLSQESVTTLDPGDVIAWLNDLVEAGVRLRSNDRYLALAVFNPFPDISTARIMKSSSTRDGAAVTMLENG